MKKIWTLETAKSYLKANDVKVGAKSISVAAPGLKLLGAIDYLTKNHEFRWERETVTEVEDAGNV